MKKLKSTILATLLSITTAYGQITTNYSDYLLATSFKAFNSVDFEMANHILPFLKKRFLNELKDSASFSNHYDSLSKYIGIRFSSDSLLKTYCWSERSGGCCHTSSAYAQFKTKSGKFNYLNLEETEDGGEDYFITDLQLIEIERKTYYLILY